MDKLKDYVTQAISFCKESWTELSKVHFNSPRETFQATAVIVVLVLVMALWLGLIDMGATRVIRSFIS